MKEFLNRFGLSLPTQQEIEGSEEEIEEIKEFEELKDLKNQLKGESEIETLTNILEWQDRNIQFWYERWIVPIFAAMGIAIGIVLEIIVGMVIILIIYLFVLKFTRYKNMDWRTIYYTLSPNPPVNKILEYRLAMCRDYSRLTSAILFNLYSEVFFISILGHVTVGLKFNDEIYVLDQHLPILTIDNDRYAKATFLKIFKATRELKEEIILGNNLREEIMRTRKPFARKPINTEELTTEVAKVMRIKQNSSKDKPDFEIELKNYVKNKHDALIKYHNDEIIKYSLIRAFKNKLESEFCSNMDKISKINIVQDKENLKLEVYKD